MHDTVMLMLTIMIAGLIFIVCLIYRKFSRMKMLVVQEPWYSEIAAGRKTVEGRTGPLSKYDYLLNQNIIVHNNCWSSRLCRVANVVHYDSLEDYLNAVGWQNCAPHAESKEAALDLYGQIIAVENGKMYRVFSEENIVRQGGINALHLLIVNNIG